MALLLIILYKITTKWVLIGCSIEDFGLRIADCGLRIADWRLTKKRSTFEKNFWMPNLYIIAACYGAGKTTASYTVLPEMLNCKEFVNEFAIAISGKCQP